MAAKLKKGDKVIVLAGKDKGKTGTVSKVNPKDGKIVVEGVNIVKRHQRPTQENPDGGIITFEGAIHISNVMLLDPKSNEPTRVGKAAITDENTGKTRHVRRSVVTGETIE